MKQKLLFLFTRTPLHVGAGASVGAIDQPIIRERHTGFPVIPASSLKGTFADAWNGGLLQEENGRGEIKRVRVKKDGTASDAAWLFGSDSDKHAAAGALQFCEARLLAFPIRSAKGSFAWITCPLMLQRAARDSVIPTTLIQNLPEPRDEEAIFVAGDGSKLDLGGQIVLEEYTFKLANSWAGLAQVGEAFAALLPSEPMWIEAKERLVILSNGMMSFFAQNACEVAQHVRISDETGTAEGRALFNQENVPSESFFYAVLHAFDERTANKAKENRRKTNEAIEAFREVADDKVFQFGGDASTGLGYCTVKLNEQGEAQP
jgi:CRISPR-associated protein Cmr4